MTDEVEEIDIYADCVDQYYQYDTETEDVIPGSELRDGMIVLLENYSLRVSKDTRKYNNLQERLLKINRFCVVTKLQDFGENYSFIGIYGDGRKMSRLEQKHHAWIVKKDSIPPAEPVVLVCEYKTEDCFGDITTYGFRRGGVDGKITLCGEHAWANALIDKRPGHNV